MRMINADALLNALGISEGGDCDKCPLVRGVERQEE